MAPENNMGGLRRGHELITRVTRSEHVDAFEQPLSTAQHDRRNGNVQLINEAGTKILLDGVRSTANAHVLPFCRITRPVKCFVGPNMFLPRIQAPIFLKLRAAKSSSSPVVPLSAPKRFRWNVRVGNAHSCKSVPPTPSGLSMF